MPTPEPRVSVVVCAFDDGRQQLLRDAVGSVERQTRAAAETIVVVDHNPGLLARAREMLPGATVLENAQERGLAGARNSGIAACTGDVVAFLDDDAAAAADWLERLVVPYARPEVIGVGGRIEAAWAEGEPAGFPAEFRWVVGCSYTGLPEAAAPVRNLIGANMSLRRDVFDRVGGFRSSLGRIGRRPTGCEETELCIRARRAIEGGVFVYEPAARVVHAVPQSRATWRYFRSRCYAEGISKARVAELSGPRDGLATERAYVARTLPAGVVRGIADAVRGDTAGLTRAGAIVGGLAVTTAGYVVGAVRGGR